MELKHIDIANLSISAANMRMKGRAPDLANILPSVRARGVLVPLIVRPNGQDGHFEIVAGRRRYLSALAIAEEAGGIDPLPCAVMAAGDDAAALEASLIENVARLDPDEVTRWETFTRLVKEGRSPEDIALTFGLTELQVKRTLSLGNLLPRIRNLYRSGDIDAVTVKHLTLASKAQQKEWLAMVDDPKAYCPCGSQLKAWLFGGMSIPTTTAIFDLASYDGEIVSDLFGDDTYFASADAFWAAQNAAVEASAEAYRADGWSEVIVLEPGQYFHSWEYERRSKAKGGKVYISLGHRGDVTFHEGYLTLKEARKQERGETVEKPSRPELSAPLANYINLHRHAAVRAAVAAKPDIALRLMLAHVIHGSMLFRVTPEPQRALTDAIAESVENCAAEAAFDERRRAVLALLGFDEDTPTVINGYSGDCGVAGLFSRLIDLPQASIRDIIAVVMAEALEQGTALIELLGVQFGVNLADCWQADDALLDLIKDREVLDVILTEVGGDEAARANAKATGKVKRTIIRDCLNGENGRAKVEGWVPKWMAFPPSSYTERGGVGTVQRAGQVAALAAVAEPMPDAQHEPEATSGAAVEPMAEAA
ncbi:MAG: ParB/RepB/Spo0J family partition protein [Pseudomonadota bacterium]|nr:ParB/RepB/Spo0J family partition protein [Pseudomonadota bacterium]